MDASDRADVGDAAQELQGLYEVMKELHIILDNDDTNVKDSQIIQCNWQEIIALHREQNEKLRILIENAEGCGDQEGAHHGELEQICQEEEILKKQILEAEQNLSVAGQEKESAAKTLENCRQQEKVLLEKKEKVAQELNRSIPAARYELNLYTLLTKIRWQFDAENEVKGFVVNKADVKPFNINRQEKSKFYVANYLWDLVDDDDDAD